MRGKGQSQGLLVKIVKSPIRALCKARDFYVRSITNCSDQLNYSNNMDPVGRFAALPRSYSTASSRSDDGDDFKELMRAASARTLSNKIDMDLILRQQQQQQQAAVGTVGNGLARSSTVAMGRIDEDKPVDFAAAVVPDLYPRSKSYAVPKVELLFMESSLAYQISFSKLLDELWFGNQLEICDNSSSLLFLG